MQLEAGLEEHELAVTGDQVIEHLGVAVAGFQPFAHQQAKVAGERRIGIVDRLVLAHHAAQFMREAACARLELGVGQDFVGLHGKARRRAQGHHRDEQQPREHRALGKCHARYSAGCNAVLALAGFGAPTRRRRSESERPPPNTITMQPSQISSTSGL